MDILFESPVTILIVGVLLSAIIFYFWKETRSKSVLILLFAMIGLTILFLCLEQAIETDNESLKDTISNLADAVEVNDIDRAMAYFSVRNEESKKQMERARAEMPSYCFRTCNVVKFSEIRVNETAVPKTAEVDFVVFVDVDAPTYGYDGSAARGVTLYMAIEREEWVVTNYEHYPIGPQRKMGGLPSRR